MAVPLLSLFLFAACDAPCESTAPGPTRDTCFHDRVTEADVEVSADSLVRYAGEIADPMMRQATVMVWVREHRGGVADTDRDRVCGLLQEGQRMACERQLSAAHLGR